MLKILKPNMHGSWLSITNAITDPERIKMIFKKHYITKSSVFWHEIHVVGDEGLSAPA